MRVAMKPSVQRKGNVAQRPRRHVVGVKKSTNRQKGPMQKTSVSEACIESRKEVDPLGKIKLQLFPVDEVTRIGLEKDGLNPFLELTLKGSKKMCSVIKHIHKKWGGSAIRGGEAMLLPYNTTTRWTLKDTLNITAGDLYTALQTPPIFRLSYGWFSPITTAAALHDATPQLPQEIGGQGLLSDISGVGDISVGGLGKLHNKEDDQQQPPIQCGEWDDDNLTALSIGGLFSEASLQAKINNNKSFSISDSLVAKPLSLDSRTSILDAEQTCHAFNFSSSTKNLIKQVEREALHTPYSPQPKIPQQFGEDSTSLGLRGITWNESFGPFDLGNSMPWKLSGGSNVR